MDITNGMQISSAITPTAGAAAATDIAGSIIDMANFYGVMAVVRMGAITQGAVTTIKWKQGDVVDSETTPTSITDAADLEGTSITIADDDDEQTFVSVLILPTDRWVQLYVDRATQNAVITSAEYIRFGARTQPTTLSIANAVTAERHISPAEGTA